MWYSWASKMSIDHVMIATVSRSTVRQTSRQIRNATLAGADFENKNMAVVVAEKDSSRGW
jgi:hypothetical protein